MRKIFLLLISALIGCGQSNTTTTNNNNTKTPTTPTEHEHPSPHGGMVVTTEDKHIELNISNEGHMDVYWLDDDVKPLSVDGVTGAVKVTFPDGIKELTLSPHDAHLAAQGPTLDMGGYFTCEMHPEIKEEKPGKCPKCGMDLIKKSAVEKLIVLVDINAQGRNYSARFEYKMNEHKGDSVAHQHDSRHGGQVVMVGENHFELATPNPGEYQVFLSNDRRAPFPASSAKDAKLTVDPDAEKPEVLPLAADPTDAFLTAKGTPPIKKPVEVKVEFTLNGEKVSVSFLVQ